MLKRTFFCLTFSTLAAATALPTQTQIAGKLSHLPESLGKQHCQGDYRYRTSPKTVALDAMTFSGLLEEDAAKTYPKHTNISVNSDYDLTAGKSKQFYGYLVTTNKGKYLNVFEGTANEYHIYSCRVK